MGLARMLEWAERLGNPQNNLRFIHVAGTNGKGSVCAYLEKIYLQAGLRVGCFTSPHLCSLGERMRIMGLSMPRAELIEQVKHLRILFSASQGSALPSFFECLTLMALRYFEAQKCDVVIWETGLGGRLDATNIVTPLCSIITQIGLDHQAWLGNSIAKIAEEKAGIIKPSIPVVIGPMPTGALRVIGKKAQAMRSKIHSVTPTGLDRGITPGLLGAHQRTNAGIALKVTEILAGSLPYDLSDAGFAIQNTQLAGRFEEFEWRGRKILLDVAHNEDAFQTLHATLLETSPWNIGHLSLVFASLDDKDWMGGLRKLSPLAERIFLTRALSDRAVEPTEMASYLTKLYPTAGGPQVICCESPGEALERAIEESTQPILATGSFYLVGAARAIILGEDHQEEASLNEWGASLSSSPPTHRPS